MVKKSKDPASIQKVSIASSAKPYQLQNNYVSPDPDEPYEEGTVVTSETEKGVDSSGGDIETFVIQPEDIEPWNPRSHPMDGDVLVYEPGFKLVYEHPHDLTHVVARFVGALVLGWLVGLFLKEVQWSVIAALSFVGFIELFRWKTGHYEATRWDWNLHRGVLQEIIGEDRFEYNFSEIKEVILKLTKTEHRWSSLLSGSGKENRFYSFNAHTLISGPDDATFSIASTGELQQHPDEVKYLGLCFAFMLAQEIKVPLRIQEIPVPEV